MLSGVVNEVSSPPITGQSSSLTGAVIEQTTCNPSSPISGLEDSDK